MSNLASRIKLYFKAVTNSRAFNCGRWCVVVYPDTPQNLVIHVGLTSGSNYLPVETCQNPQSCPTRAIRNLKRFTNIGAWQLCLKVTRPAWLDCDRLGRYKSKGLPEGNISDCPP